MLDLGYGTPAGQPIEERPVMVISTAQAFGNRPKAPSDGQYTHNGSKFKVFEGAPLPDGAVFIPKGGGDALPFAAFESPATFELPAAFESPPPSWPAPSRESNPPTVARFAADVTDEATGDIVIPAGTEIPVTADGDRLLIDGASLGSFVGAYLDRVTAPSVVADATPEDDAGGKKKGGKKGPSETTDAVGPSETTDAAGPSETS